MDILRMSSEDEMVLEFLKAEYFSDRFSEHIKEIMKEHLLNEHLILSGDINNADENTARKKLLGLFRGYGLDLELFERFPKNIKWHLCCFKNGDLKNIRYIDYSYWNELSAGTRSPLVAAKQILSGAKIYGQSSDGFLRAAEFIKKGGKFARPIFLTSDFLHFVIVEGHLRITAYALADAWFDNIECFVGECSDADLKNWM